MRPKFVLGLLLFACLVLGAAVFLKQYLGGGTANVGSVATAPPIPSNAVATAPPSSRPEPALLPAAPPPTNTVAAVTNAATPEPPAATPEPSQDAIDAEVDRLQDWSMNNDPASLSNILADLTNSVKEVREAAIDAAEQFGSTDAIPALKAAARTTEDIQEKIAYLQAADFLSLPPLDQLSGMNVSKTPSKFEEENVAAHVAHQAWQQTHPSGRKSQTATPPANGQNPSPTTPNNQ